MFTVLHDYQLAVLGIFAKSPSVPLGLLQCWRELIIYSNTHLKERGSVMQLNFPPTCLGDPKWKQCEFILH